MSRVARDIFEQATTALQIDEASGTLTFIGEAEIGTPTSEAKWKIKRMQKTGTVTAVEWADGDDKSDNVFDDRVDLAYS